MNFSLCDGRTFNNLQANFSQRNHQKEFFNTHRRLLSESRGFRKPQNSDRKMIMQKNAVTPSPPIPTSRAIQRTD